MTVCGAVLFDMDETLYAERRFALSGFAAIARSMYAGAPDRRRAVFRALAEELRHGRRPVALQALCRDMRWPETRVPELVGVIRSHVPNLRLPKATREVLERCRHQWPTAIVTNGDPNVQRRKVAALGLEPLVDAVVYAAAHGTGTGKPDPAPFVEAARQLHVSPSACVFVGDDPLCDVEGARRVGMATIRLRRGVHAAAPVSRGSDADVVLTSLRDVPPAVRFLLSKSR